MAPGVFFPGQARAARRSALLPLLALAGAAVLAALESSLLLGSGSAASAQQPAVAFVTGERTLLNKRSADGSEVTMFGGARRQNRYNKPKKLHMRELDRIVGKEAMNVPPCFMKLLYKPEPTLEIWSQTLKLSFPEGEDDVVTEKEVMEYFTTDEYAPEAVIVGHKLPHDPLKHAYVHFGTNEAAIKARKEKDGGPIGKASEVKVVYTDEKKWVRLRDGVSLSGGRRASWMKPYGDEPYAGVGEDFGEDTGTRNHPVYPVD